MRPEDAAAFCDMAQMVCRSDLTMWSSTVARDEIDRIPPEYRAAHVKEYEALRIVRASNATWLDTNPESTGFRTVVRHADYHALCGILSDETDARLVFQAKMAGLTDFVTVDYSSILNKAAAVQTQVGMRVLSPCQYVSSRTS